MAEILVKPSVTASGVIDLPPIDQSMLRSYIDFVLCFRLHPEAIPRNVYWHLRCGLSDALVEFPFFAGRIVKHDTARNRVQINLSDGDGVPFKYNNLTSPDTQSSFPHFDHLEQAHFPPSRFDSSLSSVREKFPTGSDYPALLLQANFIQGGLLLTISPHHSTSDAVGWTGFIRSWAKHTAAATKGLRITPHQSLGILDRSPLFQVNNDVALEQCEQLVKVDDVAGRTNMLNQILNSPPPKTTPSNIVNCFYYFSPERLRALKAAAQPINKTDPWVSTNDALCALLWRHMTIARQLKESGHKNSTFEIPCDVRGRLAPKLHPEYAGNAVVHAHFSYPIEELCSTAPNGLHSAASAIRKAVDRVDEPLIRKIYGVISSLPTIGSARYNLDFLLGPDFFVTTLADYDWYSFDWGNHMDRLIRQRYISIHHVSAIVVQPRLRDGGLEVFMALKSEVFERLRLDETFGTFAQLRCWSPYESRERGGTAK